MKSRRKGLACLLVLSLIVSIIFPSGSMISYAADQSSTIATTSSSDTIGVNDVSVQATKELIKNGDFSQGAQDWGIIKENNADITIVPGKATVTVTGGAITADWMPSLHQVVALDAGTNYRISVELESSVDRNIMIAKDSERTYRNPDDQKSLKANQKTTISYETGILTEAIPEFKLMIYCGILPGDSFYGNHTLTITKVSMIALPVTLPDDPCDELPSPIADITGIAPTDALVLKNGDFSKGLSNWETYAVDWMQQYDVVKYTKVENGMNVYIKNVGSDPGNNNYDVQLFQTVNLKKDLQYSISFDVHSDKARSIQVVYDGVGFLKTIGIQAGETRHVTYNVPIQSSDVSGKFLIFMGKVNGECLDNNLTFSNIKFEVNGYREKAVAINDGHFDYGMGSFTGIGDKATYDATSKKRLAVMLTQDSQLGDVIVQKQNLNLFAGKTYELRFTAGSRLNHNIKVIVEANGSNIVEKDYTLTTNVSEHVFEFTPIENVSNATLKLLVGGIKTDVYFDNIRVDVKGITTALGINTIIHDITDLLNKETPVISEDCTDNVIGNDIELTFNSNEDYSNAMKSILLDGVDVTAECTFDAGKITLPSRLFAITDSATEKAFKIVINADWYDTVTLNQVIYKENKWILTWNDEFNGTSVDTTKWGFQNGTGAEYGIDGWGNNELQYYTNDNVKVNNSVLTIEAKKEAKNGKTYTSGRMWTLGNDKENPLFAQKYGKFEAKIKSPGGDGLDGLWPAFWLLPADTTYGVWASSGEIDIMEARGRIADTVGGTIHYGQTWPNNASSGGEFTHTDGTDNNDYHIYSLEWEPGEIRWYVDGKLYHTENSWYSKGEGNPANYPYPAPFDRPFYIVLNLAIGGTYDGNRVPSDAALPANMQVDYVRVYQYSGEYADPVEPVIPKEEIPDTAKKPDSTGNYIVDNNYDQVNIVSNSNTAIDTNGWNFLTLPDFSGVANLTKDVINGSTFATANISNVGTAAYSVQLIQQVPLVKGRFYELSFDAKSNANRSMTVKVGDTGDNGWGTYSGFNVDLTSDVTHYKHTFQMTKETDLTSRVEFNMGLNDKPISIANVVFKEVENYTIDDDIVKKPLDNGNHVYNGTFDQGRQDRLTYWHVSGTTGHVLEQEGNYRFTATTAATTNEQTLYQKGLELLQNDTYQVSFDASSTVSRDLVIKVTNADGSITYGSKSVTLDNILTGKSIDITMPAVTDKQGSIVFYLSGSDGTICIDNIVVKRITNNNVDYTGIDCYPLNNGDFSSGIDFWSQYGANISVSNGVLTSNITAGGNVWDKMIIYSNLNMFSGFTYEFSFDAKASTNVTTDITFEDSNYARSYEQSNVALTTEWKRYAYTFKINEDKNLALKFLLGGESNNFDFYMDNVVLQIKGAPMKPAFLSVKNNGAVVGDNVEINHTGDSNWMNAITDIFINNVKVDSSKYSVNANSIILDKSLFAIIGSYSIKVKATGYSETNVVIQRIYPADGNRIQNGTFDDGLNSYFTWSKDDCAQFTTDQGYLDVLSKFKAFDGSNTITWSIQLKQSDIAVEAGKEYQFSFKGYSTIERSIIIEGINNTKIDLTTEPKVYTINFTPNSNTLTVNFLMGTVGDVPDAVHHIYLDDISLIDKAIITPTATPTETPTVTPTVTPTETPTVTPTVTPTETPTVTPTVAPTETPTVTPTETPTVTPTETPTVTPTVAPTETPTVTPTVIPTVTPTTVPTTIPAQPTQAPVQSGPEIKGNNGTKGWDAILDTIKNLPVNSNPDSNDTNPNELIIDMNTETVLPENIIRTLTSSNTNLVLKMDGYSWLIHGNTIENSDEIKDIDLKVSEIENKVDLKALKIAIDKLLENSNSRDSEIVNQFEIAHNGAFPFEATLSFNIGKEFAGKTLFLNYYNEKTKKFELCGKYVVDSNGMISMEFSHASKYVLTSDNLVKPEIITKKSIYENQSYYLKPTNVLKEAVVTYKSSNKKVATISKDGKIKAIAPGKTTITTVIKQNSETFTFKTVVTVKEIKFQLDKKVSKLNVGETFEFTVETKGIKGTITWSTSNQKIASVTSNGKLTAKKKGTVYVYATADGLTIKYKVTIK